jgi:transketolase
VQRGAYVLWDSGAASGAGQDPDAGSEPELILISTGAEVPLTLRAGKTLAGEGTRVRVVSMPCMDLFEEQSQEYRDEVLPPAVRTRLAVEPGATISWGKWVGLDGDVIGLDRFGASAPGPTVLEKLGFTVENITARARALLEREAH